MMEEAGSSANVAAEMSIEQLADRVWPILGDAQVDELLKGWPPREQDWPNAYVQIVKQPAPRAHRFRYECEGRSAGSIPGASSDPTHKTYPTIRIHNYEGPVTIYASCVTKDFLLAHPNGLVGRNCQRGVFRVEENITAHANTYTFNNLGIQCTKRNKVGEALHWRKIMNIDPFHNGFEHASSPGSVDRHAVRLAFQVVIRDRPLPAVASDVVYDRKALGDLVITDASHDSGPVSGGTQIFLFCEKVPQGTQVQFLEEDAAGAVVWSSLVAPTLVHKQVALKVTTPQYNRSSYNPLLQQENISVWFRLIRYERDEEAGGARLAAGNKHPFIYLPDVRDVKKRKAVLPCLQNIDENTLVASHSSSVRMATLVIPKTESKEEWASEPNPSPSANCYGAGGPTSVLPRYASIRSPSAGSQPSHESGPPPTYSGNLSSYAGVPPAYTTQELSNVGGAAPEYGSPNARYDSYIAEGQHAAQGSGGAGASGARQYARRRHNSALTSPPTPPTPEGRAPRADRPHAARSERTPVCQLIDLSLSPHALFDASPPCLDLQTQPPPFAQQSRTPAPSAPPPPAALSDEGHSEMVEDGEDFICEFLDRLNTCDHCGHCVL